MKKFISILLASVLLLTIVPVFATDAGSPAVYLNGDFFAASMTVNGDIVSVNGTATFNHAGDNFVNGNVIVKDEGSYITENKYSLPHISGEVKAQSGLPYSFRAVEIAAAPEIGNVIDSFTFGYWPLADPVTSDTYYKKLTVENELVVDTTTGDITIVADVLNLTGKIRLLGDGKLTLYINNSLIAGGSASINKDGNPENVSVIFTGDMDLSNNAKVNANVYCGGENMRISNSVELYGNIYSNATKAAFEYNVAVYGTVYLPSAAVDHLNSSKIYGTLVADSLKMSGTAMVNYDEKYAIVNPFEGKSDAEEPEESEPEEDEKNEDMKIDSVEDDKVGIDNTEVSDELILDNLPNTEYKPGKLENEYAYIYGYTDVCMAPNEKVIRSEASALLYRLMKQNNMLDGYKKPANASYNDLSANDWFFNGIEYMTHLGVYNSKGVSSVYPGQPITRGEAAKMFVFAMGLEITDNDVDFDDLSKDNVCYKYIATMADNGYMDGYGNKTIKPNDFMSRAEFVKIYNIIIGRDDSYDYTTTVDGEEVECKFADLSPSDWYYDDLMRATHSFTGKRVDPDKRLDRSEIDK